MPTLWGDTVIYAFEYPPASIDSIFTSVLSASDLLPSSVVAGRANTEVLDVEVTDGIGTPLFRSERAGRFDLDGAMELPASYAGLKVRAQLKPEMAEAILIGGVPESRVPILLVILVLAIGLTLLAAVQLRREVRFAAERAGFVANVSHELRTPLSQIRLVLDTLKLGRGEDPATRDQALKVADREALRLQHLVEGVLRFTRGTRADDSPRVGLDAAQEARAVIEEFSPTRGPPRHDGVPRRDAAGPRAAAARRLATDPAEPPRQRHEIRRRWHAGPCRGERVASRRRETCRRRQRTRRAGVGTQTDMEAVRAWRRGADTSGRWQRDRPDDRPRDRGRSTADKPGLSHRRPGGARFIVELPDEGQGVKRVLVVEDQRDLASCSRTT